MKRQRAEISSNVISHIKSAHPIEMWRSNKLGIKEKVSRGDFPRLIFSCPVPSGLPHRSHCVPMNMNPSISGAVVRDGRLELPTSCSQSKRATNCANPGFWGIQFCSRCGQTCGQAVFLTTSTCERNACIAGVSMDCGNSIFRLEGGATRSQTRRDTNFAIPGYSLFCHDTTANGKNKVFSVCGHSCGQSRFCAVFGNRGKSSKRRCRKALRRFASPYPGYRHGTPKASALPTALIPDMKFRLIRRPDVLTQECVCKWLRHRT